MNSSDALALRYNDAAPMENHHLAAAFTLMSGPPYGFIAHLPKVDRRDADPSPVGTLTRAFAFLQPRAMLDAHAAGTAVHRADLLYLPQAGVAASCVIRA